MELTPFADLAALAIVGAIVSLFVQMVKGTLNASRSLTIATVVVFSLIAGGLWFLIKDNAHFIASATQILLFANAVYGFFLSALEKPQA